MHINSNDICRNFLLITVRVLSWYYKLLTKHAFTMYNNYRSGKDAVIIGIDVLGG